jgi:hypothetical protein
MGQRPPDFARQILRVEVDECYLGGLEEGLPGRLKTVRTASADDILFLRAARAWLADQDPAYATLWPGEPGFDYTLEVILTRSGSIAHDYNAHGLTEDSEVHPQIPLRNILEI